MVSTCSNNAAFSLRNSSRASDVIKGAASLAVVVGGAGCGGRACCICCGGGNMPKDCCKSCEFRSLPASLLALDTLENGDVGRLLLVYWRPGEREREKTEKNGKRMSVCTAFGTEEAGVALTTARQPRVVKTPVAGTKAFLAVGMLQVWLQG